MKNDDFDNIALIILVLIAILFACILLRGTYYSNDAYNSYQTRDRKYQESVQSSLAWKYVEIY